ncbi:23478_t:CDS:2, partial [Gigaspora margarita]
MSRKINALFIIVILTCIVIQFLKHEDEIHAKDEKLLFMVNEIHRYEDKIYAKDKMLLFMENKIHQCDEKLDESVKMLLKLKDLGVKMLLKWNDLSITKEEIYSICVKELQRSKFEIEYCEYK